MNPRYWKVYVDKDYSRLAKVLKALYSITGVDIPLYKAMNSFPSNTYVYIGIKEGEWNWNPIRENDELNKSFNEKWFSVYEYCGEFFLRLEKLEKLNNLDDNAC